MDEYISTFPKNVADVLKELRKTIKEEAPQAEELISYNMPAYKQNGFLVSFAAWKTHIGLYPIPAGDEDFKKEVAGYKSHKSTLQFPYSEPLPLEFIKKVVRLRIEENTTAATLKAKKK